ncbi:M20 family metallopeptidase [Histidinibacterium lentulum]|nr:M20/M25/M40 family metallo-hydrolase [Histidinibacterium lentulum]
MRDDIPTEAEALLSALVTAESVNPPGRTVAAAAVAEDWLAARGLGAETVAAVPEKPNLVVRVENGAGPHLVLNAHLDTVPPGDRAAWSVEPLALTPRDGRLYGLGTGNMKGAAAAMMLATDRLARDRAAWRGTLTLTLVADECTFGPDGAAHLLKVRPDLLGDWLICGEGPGGMHLAVAEKGLLWVRLRARGRVGQGMLTTRGSAATARLAGALAEIDGWNEMTAVPPQAGLDHDANREGMRLSANIGRIAGGAFVSQAASAAEAEIDFRLPVGLTVAEMGARLDALCAARPGLSWEVIKGWDPNGSDPEGAVAEAVRAAATEVRGAAPRDVTRLPASDASRWRARGVPAVCYGPQPDLASGVDDHVVRADFLDCIRVYERAAHRLLAPQTAE